MGVQLLVQLNGCCGVSDRTQAGPWGSAEWPLPLPSPHLSPLASCLWFQSYLLFFQFVSSPSVLPAYLSLSAWPEISLSLPLLWAFCFPFPLSFCPSVFCCLSVFSLPFSGCVSLSLSFSWAFSPSLLLPSCLQASLPCLPSPLRSASMLLWREKSLNGPHFLHLP